MSSSPFMQLYVGDYLADTLDLTTEQHGAYLLLLMTMWRHGAKLPNDPAKLCRVARVSPKRWPTIWSEISRFFDTEGGFITNKRLTKEHQKALSISHERKTAGSLGGKANALKRQEAAQATATDLLKHSQKPDIREEKEEPNGSSKKRASRLSPDWVLPKAWGEWATAQNLSEPEVRSEGEKFHDYWVALSGKAATKLDWEATWRNWIRKALADRTRGGLRSITGGKRDWKSGDYRIVRDFVQEYDGYEWGKRNDLQPADVEDHPRLIARIA